MERVFGQEYNEADVFFSQGLVTKFHLPKLFAADDLLVATEMGEICAYTEDFSPEDPSELSCWT
jgi:hypothetical protein